MHFSKWVLSLSLMKTARSTEEIQVGDNDNLAAHIAALVHADLLILLTDVEAVYDSPREKVRTKPS